MKKETYLKLVKQKRKAKLLAILTLISLVTGMIKNNKVNAETYNKSTKKEQILELILEKAIIVDTYDEMINKRNNNNQTDTTSYTYETQTYNNVVTYSLKNNSDIAHRGYSPGGVYENSIEAFKLAGENGFWGCEADVRFDKHGNLVCSHDSVKSGQNPPSFEQYLQICKNYGMTAIIDLKYKNGPNKFDENLSRSILRTIKKMEMIDNCILQTNNPTDVPYIRENSKNARIWYLTDVISNSNIKMIKENNVECVNIQYSDNIYTNKNKIDKLTDNGIETCVWNVTSEYGKNSVLNMGAKYVMSDYILGVLSYQKNENISNSLQAQILESIKYTKNKYK